MKVIVSCVAGIVAGYAACAFVSKIRHTHAVLELSKSNSLEEVEIGGMYFVFSRTPKPGEDGSYRLGFCEALRSELEGVDGPHYDYFDQPYISWFNQGTLDGRRFARSITKSEVPRHSEAPELLRRFRQLHEAKLSLQDSIASLDLEEPVNREMKNVMQEHLAPILNAFEEIEQKISSTK